MSLPADAVHSLCVALQHNRTLEELYLAGTHSVHGGIQFLTLVVRRQ